MFCYELKGDVRFRGFVQDGWDLSWRSSIALGLTSGDVYVPGFLTQQHTSVLAAFGTAALIFFLQLSIFTVQDSES